MMDNEQKFLLDNKLADLVLSKPNNPLIYVSDLMRNYLKYNIRKSKSN